MRNDFRIGDQEYRFFKKRDTLAYLIFFAVIMFVIFSFFGNNTGDKITVLIGGKKTYEFDKNTKGVYALKNDANDLLMNLVIDENGIYIRDSACPLKICEKHGYLSRNFDAIVCVPQKVIIRFSENEKIVEDLKYDIITK